jgi:hypothetical protein
VREEIIIATTEHFFFFLTLFLFDGCLYSTPADASNHSIAEKEENNNGCLASSKDRSFRGGRAASKDIS